MDFKKKFTGCLTTIKGDILGGIVSAIVALPQALAFGVATGLGASSGLWGAIILCFVSGILGTKVPLISGPTGPVAIVAASCVSNYTNDMNAIMLVFLTAGIIQVIISLTNAPDIVKYVPYPVISGFTNGVGTILILLQLAPIIGIEAKTSVIASIKDFILNINNVDYSCLVLGIITILTIFIIPKKIKRIIPAEIIALILCTYISIKFNFDVATISKIGVSFPQFNVPYIDLELIYKIIPFALTIAIVCSSESMLTSLVADSLTNERTNPKKLLLSQGMGNIACSLLSSMPGSAATMRTVAAIKTGAKTKLSTIISPLFLIVLLLNFSNFVEKIPICVLSGILIKIGIDIIDLKLVKVMKYAPKDDIYVLFAVYLLTVFYNLIFAIGAGIVLASLLYAKRVADKTNLINTTYKIDNETLNLEKELTDSYHYQIRVVHIIGQFFFGSSTRIVSQFDEMLGTKYLIINYESSSLLDISAVFALEDIIERLKSQHIKIMMIIKNEAVLNQLKSLNIISQIGEENIFHDEKTAIKEAKLRLKDKIRA